MRFAKVWVLKSLSHRVNNSAAVTWLVKNNYTRQSSARPKKPSLIDLTSRSLSWHATPRNCFTQKTKICSKAIKFLLKDENWPVVYLVINWQCSLWQCCCIAEKCLFDCKCVKIIQKSVPLMHFCKHHCSTLNASQLQEMFMFLKECVLCHIKIIINELCGGFKPTNLSSKLVWAHSWSRQVSQDEFLR